MYRQQNGGIAGLDLVAAIIGAVIGGAIVAVVWVVMSILKSFVKFAVWSFAKFRGNPVQRNSVEDAVESVVPQSAPLTATTSTDADLAQLYSKAFERRFLDSFNRRVEGKGGYATIWFYPHQGVARRTVTVTGAALAKKLGKRHSLPEIAAEDSPDSIESVIQQTKAELDLVLSVEKRKGADISRQSSVLSDSNPPPVPDNVGGNNLQVPAVTRRKPRQKQVAYRGNIVRHGLEQVGEGDNAYKCYCLHIDDASLGSVHRVIGTDLERAISEAGVKDGDFVEVAQVGEIPTAGGRKKNVFAIQKLARAFA